MKIVKEYRKSLVLKINHLGEVEIKAPFFMSNDKILNFVNSKQNWIDKQLRKFEAVESFVKEFDFNKYVYLNNENYDWQTLLVQKQFKTKKTYYTKNMQNFLEINALNIAKKLNVNVTFRSTSSRRIWGSCNSSNLIKINWKITILPQELQEYILIHELCHILELNHSKAFWNNVERYCPDYKNLRNMLKKYSFLLNTNIF